MGMMSGTSADGIDAALLRFSPDNAGEFCGHWHFPYPPALQERIFALQEGGESRPLLALDREIGRLHGQFACQIFAAGQEFQLIALHGQTVAHQPDGEHGYTWQIGSAYDLADATGCSVAHDFRRADLAQGGQGAPLVPIFHAALLAADTPLLVLNVGGMANLSWLPARGQNATVQAFDTGPGNVLIDSAVQLLSTQRFDAEGHWAAQGQVQERELQQWLRLPYFHRPPPKSTGRELFHAAWVRQQWADWRHEAADFLATLTALSARSIAAAAQSWLPPAQRLLVFGGGARNRFLLALLQDALPQTRVELGEETCAVPAQAMEALAFAWLGGHCLLGTRLDLHGVTGQRRATVLGSLYPGRNWPEVVAWLSRTQASGGPAC
ncbi:MAG: anhydro-N-acetylmuramic acid kinase [Acidithiobacillus sp.]|nr:anhydro-N-acetylmuramic acid kinase [Acidithiobacillus sp.]